MAFIFFSISTNYHPPISIIQNVEYARSLLLRLERESAAVKVYSRKQSLQSELKNKRDTIRKLNRRLRELDQLDDDDNDDDDDGIPSEDGIYYGNGNGKTRDGDTTTGSRNHSNGYAPARSASAGLDVQTHEETEGSMQMQRAAGELTSVLRARRGQAVAGQDTAVASGNTANYNKPSKESDTATLFSTSAPTSTNLKSPSTLLNQSSTSASDETSRIAQHEKLLTHNRAEEQVLTESLLSMAQALKSSARQFQTTLEVDKEVLGTAVEGLDKNTEGMDAAGMRMTQLRRRSSGWAWWRHVSLYVWIAGLYVALVLVFMLPKLRL